MREYYCVVFARHERDNRAYLFEVDPITNIKDGEEIIVDTVKGQSGAWAVGGSFMIDKRGIESIAKAIGAYFPLKKVIGFVEYETVQNKKVIPINENNQSLPF